MGFDTRDLIQDAEDRDDIAADYIEQEKEVIGNFINHFKLFYKTLDKRTYGDTLNMDNRIRLYQIYLDERRGHL